MRGYICKHGLRTRRNLSLCVRASRRELLFSAKTSSLFVHGTHLLRVSLRGISCLVLSRKRDSRAKNLHRFLRLGGRTAIIYGHRTFSPGFGSRHRGKVGRARAFSLSHFHFVRRRARLLPDMFLFPSVSVVSHRSARFRHFQIRGRRNYRVPSAFRSRLTMILMRPSNFSMLDTYSRQKVAGVLQAIHTTFPRSPYGLLLNNFRVRGTRRQGCRVVTSCLGRCLPHRVNIYRYAKMSGCTFFCGSFNSEMFCGCAKGLVRASLLGWGVCGGLV